MSKSKSKPAKSRSGHPARRTSNGASVFEQPVRNAMLRYVAQLRAFFNERHSAADTEAGIEGMVTLLTVHSRLRTKVSVTELEHDALAIQFGDLRAIGDDVAIACASILKEFVMFLAETGLWSGTVEEFKAVFELISAQSGESPVVVPELDEATADEKWLALPLVATTRQLLAWVGEGRAVRPNGLLEESEIVSAAAAIGIEVVFDTDAQPETFSWVPAAGTAVGSLAHIPKLSTYWDALLRAGLLTKQDNQAVPTPVVSEALLADHGFGARGIKDIIAEGIYAHVLLNAIGPENDHTVTQMAAALLSKAGSNNPPRSEVAFQIPAVDELEPEQAHLQPLFEKTIPGAEAILRALEAEGMVRIGKHLRVPRVLRAPLERALTRVAEEVLG